MSSFCCSRACPIPFWSILTTQTFSDNSCTPPTCRLVSLRLQEACTFGNTVLNLQNEQKLQVPCEVWSIHLWREPQKSKLRAFFAGSNEQIPMICRPFWCATHTKKAFSSVFFLFFSTFLFFSIFLSYLLLGGNWMPPKDTEKIFQKDRARQEPLGSCTQTKITYFFIGSTTPFCDVDDWKSTNYGVVEYPGENSTIFNSQILCALVSCLFVLTSSFINISNFNAAWFHSSTFWRNCSSSLHSELASKSPVIFTSHLLRAEEQKNKANSKQMIVFSTSPSPWALLVCHVINRWVALWAGVGGWSPSCPWWQQVQRQQRDLKGRLAYQGAWPKKIAAYHVALFWL